MSNKIVVIGSSNIDLIMKMDHLPEKGETVTDAEFTQTFGGKGANQAVGAARAGGHVALVNCIGDDVHTSQMLDNYALDGIDISYVYREPNVTSGHALIMIDSEGNNYISVAPGANYRLTPDKIDRARPIIRDAALVIVQFEILPETLVSILQTARGFNVPVLLNFAPARSFDLSYMDFVSILVVNEVEAEVLSGESDIRRQNVESAARKLRSMGAGTVIVTMGKEGAFVLSEDLSTHVDAFEVEAVDTTAAGDVFCGALGVAHVEGMPLDKAVRFASAASAISVTKLGAQHSAPERREIDNFLDSHGGL